MPDSTVAITSRCGCATSGTFLLPRGNAQLSSILVTTSGGKRRLFNGGIRNEEGTAACVPASAAGDLGGEGAEVTFRPARAVDVIRYRPSTLANVIVTVLTFVGAVVTAYEGFIKAHSDTSDPLAAQFALLLFLVVLVTALWPLWKAVTGSP